MTDTTEDLQEFVSTHTRRAELVAKSVEAIRETWRMCSGEERAPSAQIVSYLLLEHHPATLDKAISITANKIQTGTLDMDGSGWYYYLLGVLRNISTQQIAPRPLLTTDDVEEVSG